jgi:hypothetical protein
VGVDGVSRDDYEDDSFFESDASNQRDLTEAQWTLDIACPNGWSGVNDEAVVLAEEPDGCSWQMVVLRTPTGQAILKSIEAHVWFDESGDPDGDEYVHQVSGPHGEVTEDGLKHVLSLITQQLGRARQTIERLSFDLRHDAWAGAGAKNPPILYAKVAALYQAFADLGGEQIIDLLTDAMGIQSKDTAKSRLRVAKNLGFLTTVGKGQRGNSRMTDAAIALIESEQRR